MRRIHRQGERQVWFDNLKAPYIVDSPFGGEDIALLLSWAGALPADLQKESFARRMISAGAREVVLSGFGADEFKKVFEWASASRFQNLEVPAGRQIPVTCFEETRLAEAVTQLVRKERAGTAPAHQLLILAFAADAIREAELERFVGVAFGAAGGEAGARPPAVVAPATPPPIEFAERVSVSDASVVSRGHDHALFFEPGRWRFAGAEFDGKSSENPIAGRVEVVQNSSGWTVDAPLGSAHLSVRLPSAAHVALAVSWIGESREFGNLEGTWAVSGDSVLTTFLRARSFAGGTDLIGSEVAIRRTPVLYEVRGAVMESGQLVTSWRGELRRATALAP